MSETITFEFGRGDTVEHMHTPYKGTVIALTKWFNGCTRVTVQTSKLEAGKPVEAQAFDAEELVLVKSGYAPSHPVGGPKPTPTRRNVSRGR
jgi:hypothetical protein